MEGEVCRGEIVYEERYDIADGVRGVDLDEQLTQQIHGIVYASRETAVEDKTQELRLAGIAMKYGIDFFHYFAIFFPSATYMPGFG